MKVRLFMDVEIDDEHLEKSERGVSAGHARYESLRFASFVATGKPEEYDGPPAKVVAIHIKAVYPDPAGTITFDD